MQTVWFCNNKIMSSSRSGVWSLCYNGLLWYLVWSILLLRTYDGLSSEEGGGRRDISPGLFLYNWSSVGPGRLRSWERLRDPRWFQWRSGGMRALSLSTGAACCQNIDFLTPHTTLEVEGGVLLITLPGMVRTMLGSGPIICICRFWYRLGSSI